MSLAVSQYFKRLFPITTWITRYNKEWAIGDALAGLTVGMMVLPQSMAYAKIIGLPLQHGLYSSFVGVLIYMFFATSKDATIGPSAVVTFMTAQTLASYPAIIESMGIVAFACTTAFCAGAIELIIGFFNLGMLVDFISGPTIIGFTTGAAVATQISQLPSFFGISGINNNLPTYIVFYDFIKAFGRVTNDAYIGCGMFLFLAGWKALSVKFTERGYSWGPLFGNAGNAAGIIVFTSITFVWNTVRSGTINVFGPIPSGLNYLKAPTLQNLGIIIPAAATIVMAAIIEHVAVTKSYGKKNGYKIDPNQEIIALGFTNFLGSFVGSFPTTGSFSRSAVKSRSGVATPMAGIVTGSIVLFSIYFMTGIFAQIPNACLASLICFNLIDLICSFDYLKRLWIVEKLDLMVFLLAFWVPMFSNIQTGIYCSVAFSMIVMLYRIAKPSVYPLVMEPNGNWIPLKTASNDDLRPPEGIAVLRIEESLTFSNASYVNSTIYRLISSSTENRADPNRKKLWCEGILESDIPIQMWNIDKPILKGVILDMSSVSNMDSTGLQALIDTRKDLERHAGGKIDWHFIKPRRKITHYLNIFYTEFQETQDSVIGSIKSGIELI